MKIVVGLGNPGSRYEATRHNVGWMVLDRIADRAGWSGRGKERDSALSVRGRWADEDLLLVKPLTYMNESGLAVRKILARERVPLTDVLVVVDDFSLPLGRLRLREEGSAGGHNGLKSIIAEMGTQRFSRLRVGIGEPGQNVVDHVLSKFAASEQADLAKVIDASTDAVADWVRQGAARSANRWNAWTLAPAVAPEPGAEGTKAAKGGRAKDGRTDDRAGSAPADGPAEPVDAPGPGGRSAPDADGIVRTKTGWRKLLPGGSAEDPGR
ncbi:MAG: aminoacyl-tRNA hydrolase [Chloroflexota bacterium]